MLFRNKSKEEPQKTKKNDNSLYPVLHVMGSLKDYHTELVQKEVASLKEISGIGSSFGNVLEEADHFQENSRISDKIFTVLSRCPVNSLR